MQKLVDDIREPKVVFDLKPVDVGYIVDPGMRAVVALATSLEWNVVHRNNSPVTLIARDGFKHVLPTNTSVRFNVFTNRVNATITHSLTAIPSPELMEKIIKQYKLGPSHARVFRAAAGDGVMEGIVSHDEPDEHLEPVLHVEEEMVPEEPLESTYSLPKRWPYIAHDNNGRTYESAVVDTDGEKFYCSLCGWESDDPMPVTGHFNLHRRNGQQPPREPGPLSEERDSGWFRGAKARQAARKVPLGVRPKPKPEIVERREKRVEAPPKVVNPLSLPPMEGEPPAIDSDVTVEAVAEMVRTLIAQATAGIAAERDEALAEVERLRNSLKSLRDLIGGEIG